MGYTLTYELQAVTTTIIMNDQVFCVCFCFLAANRNRLTKRSRNVLEIGKVLLQHTNCITCGHWQGWRGLGQDGAFAAFPWFGEGCFSIPTTRKKGTCSQGEPPKKPLLLSMKYCLVNMDSYNGFIITPFLPGQYNPLYNPTNQGFFHCSGVSCETNNRFPQIGWVDEFTS